MEDGCADCGCDFGTVDAGSCSIGSCRKADLVINNNVDSSTDGVVLERLHLEALVDDALTSNGGITVNDNRNNLLAVFLLSTKEVLFGTATSLYTWVDSFQMRWVSHQSQLDFVTRVSVTSTESCSEMVFDITSLSIDSLRSLLWLNTLELCHDDLHRLPDNISQCVQTSSMCHTDDKGSSALLDS